MDGRLAEKRGRGNGKDGKEGMGWGCQRWGGQHLLCLKLLDEEAEEEEEDLETEGWVLGWTKAAGKPRKGFSTLMTRKDWILVLVDGRVEGEGERIKNPGMGREGWWRRRRWSV